MKQNQEVMVQAFNTSNQEAEADRSLRVWGQFSLQREFQVSQDCYPFW